MNFRLLCVLGVVHFATACKNDNNYSIRDKAQYENSKASLEKEEKKHPERFLKITATHKRNLLGQTVVKGNVFNQAKMVHFKDVLVKLSFYSSTGTLLGEDRHTIYEAIAPGASISFKSKNFAPKATDSVAFKVETAKY